ncbi:Lamin Tail Domain [bacterium A37T11]|nr:Lamin Tail Domain [bacterium A37T11]
MIRIILVTLILSGFGKAIALPGTTFLPRTAVQPFDVVFNEIMANPNGVNDLPTAEYVELYNRSLAAVSLFGWKYRTQTISANLVINPGEYVLICRKSDSVAFSAYGKVIALSTWPALSNTGAALSLYNLQGQLIDEVTYSDSWYRDNQKMNGGWSLERINTGAFCMGADNWIASTDKNGGTPGKTNSVRDESTAEKKMINSLLLVDSLQLEIGFSVSVDQGVAANVTHYRANNGVGLPNKVTIQNDHTVLLGFDKPFNPGHFYDIVAENLADCAQNWFNSSSSFFIPETPIMGDLLLNEILSNPNTGGVDFVEVYNASQKILDLSRFTLGSLRNNGNFSQVSISPVQLLVKPNEYRVLTIAPEIIRQHYHCPYPDVFIKMGSLPPFINDNGNAVIKHNGKTIDSLCYGETSKGVSVERIQFSKAAYLPENLHYAASTAGFATPGYKNSESMDSLQAPLFQLVSKTFSPDQDGFEDELQLKFTLPESGYMASVEIYHESGLLIRRLLRNQSIATDGLLTWDGYTDGNSIAPPGIYIIQLELYHLNGTRKHYRKGFVLARPF